MRVEPEGVCCESAAVPVQESPGEEGGRKVNDEFGKRLRSARRNRRLSAKGLAIKSGVAVASIYGYEYGDRDASLSNAIRLADALDVSLDWLTGRKCGK